MSAAPGWYPQPDGRERYWDGAAWTEQMRDPGADERAGRPAWYRTRTALGVGAGLLGLVLGTSLGSGDDADVDDLTAQIQTLRDDAAGLEDEVADAEKAEAAASSDVRQQIAAAVAEAKSRSLKAQRTAVRQAVAKAVAKERAKADARVRAAQQEAAASEPRSLVGDGGGTDPRFGTCGEANDNGYGPYHQGQDAEYDWYTDRDGDGIVCEP